jgi:ABC-type multidrug transport system permease subunit
MAYMRGQVQAMHDEIIYAQQICNESQECPELFKKHLNTMRDALVAELASTHDFSKLHVRVSRIDALLSSNDNVGLMLLLSLIFFLVVLYTALVRFGGRMKGTFAFAFVLAVSLIAPAAMLI